MNKIPNVGAFDLNKTLTTNTDGPDRRLADLSLTSGKVTAYFRMLEENFVRHLQGADAVFGCMAWMTNFDILRALEDVRCGVQIIVQKEDFLRPDVGQADDLNWKDRLRIRYDWLRPVPYRLLAPGLVAGLSCSDGNPMAAVRCVGNHNKSRKPAFPRMHNKFIVFCSAKIHYHDETDMDFVHWRDNEQIYHADYKPYAVWTGSFNFSDNGTKSFENAVVIEDVAIAEAYLEEWGQIAALSEPLDWSSEWMAPEWRIGT